MSLSEARSIWSLVQIDEFVYSMLLANRGYVPKVHGSCGHIFALDRIQNQGLPFNEKRGKENKQFFLSEKRMKYIC